MKDASMGTDRNPYKLPFKDYSLIYPIGCPLEFFEGKTDMPSDMCRCCSNQDCSLWWLNRKIRRGY